MTPTASRPAAGPRRRAPAGGPRARGNTIPEPGSGPSEAHTRFLRLDLARAEREWQRYEGTAQRDLFRELRERFLARHARAVGWALDAASGPGRFSRLLGTAASRRVAFDLSPSMLRLGRERVPTVVTENAVEPVRGDALRPPFAPSAFGEIALLGNALGFEGADGPSLLDAVEALMAPGARLLVEIAPGPGERSGYLARLPPGAVRRLLAAPAAAVVPRVEREGFRREAERHEDGAFRRWEVGELRARWDRAGWTVHEVMAVAPALGPDADRVSAVAAEPKAWSRLLELEELLGRKAARWPDAAAVLLAVERPRVDTIR